MATDAPGARGLAFTLRPALPAEIDLLYAVDDDSMALYAQHGMPIVLAPDHVFGVDERARWLRSTELARAFVAADPDGQPLGFAALDVLDGEPYLDQLSVRVSAMRRGVGRSLLERAAEWARSVGGGALWLTTYAHLPFNRGFYERFGFSVVPETACGAGIRHHLDEQRIHLPAPSERVAMRRPL